LPSELFQIVVSCKIVNSSMKSKFIHKIFVIQEMCLVFFNLLRGPDITHSGARSGPRVVHPCPRETAYPEALTSSSLPIVSMASMKTSCTDRADIKMIAYERRLFCLATKRTFAKAGATGNFAIHAPLPVISYTAVPTTQTSTLRAQLIQSTASSSIHC